MKHFLLPDFKESSGPVTLDKKDTHYIKNVRRYREGDVFTAVDRGGVIYDAQLKGFDNKNAVLSLKKKKHDGEEIRDNIPEIILYQCLLKGKKMDIVIRQATEAGVSVIIPVESEFAVVKIEEGSQMERAERWRKICREAIQQSGSTVFPEIKNAVSLAEVPLLCRSSEKTAASIFFHQKHIENKSLHQYLFLTKEKINIIVGPEGGFSDREIKYLQENCFVPAYLGKNVLRAETAAVYSIAAVKTILLERDTWTLT